MRTYRAATDEDCFDIANISIEGWRFAYKGIMPDETLNTLDANARAEGRAAYIKENPLSSIVCTENNKLVGFVDYEKCRDSDSSDSTGEVWAIYVLPEYIGQGIGRELFSKALADLSQRGFTDASVWVLQQNHIARGFYERQGFTADGVQREYQGLPEIRYQKLLQPAL